RKAERRRLERRRVEPAALIAIGRGVERPLRIRTAQTLGDPPIVDRRDPGPAIPGGAIPVLRRVRGTAPVGHDVVAVPGRGLSIEGEDELVALEPVPPVAYGAAVGVG